MLFITNLLVIYPNTENIESNKTIRDKTEKTLYKNRKANYLSIHRGLEGREGYS